MSNGSFPYLRSLCPGRIWSWICLWATICSLTACGHPAEQALQGCWLGESVENFEAEFIAPATGWARGTSFEFSGRRLKVSLPDQKPKTGVYELASIDQRTIVLSVLGSEGESSEMELIVDDATSMRWVIGDGRTMVLKKK